MLSRRRFEALTVGECMAFGVSTGELRGAFLPTHVRGGARLQAHQEVWLREAATGWVGWVMDALAVELVRGHFYVTEAEGHRHALFFYRKPVFNALRREALHSMQAGAGAALRRISRAEALDLLGRRNWGAGRLRILPKKGGVRPIANMAGPVTIRLPNQPRQGPGGARSRTLRSHNRSLAPAFEILGLESSLRGASPRALGLSVFDFQGMYVRLLPFYVRWREAVSASRGAGIRPYIRAWAFFL